MDKDFEQLYYDALYEIKQLKNKIQQLEDEKEVILIMNKNKDIKQVLSKEIVRYLNRKK